MLSELHEIATLLERAGVTLSGVGSKLIPYSKSPFLVTYVNPKGSIHRMEIHRSVSGPGKIAPNNRASFPAVALRVPETELIGLRDDQVKKERLALIVSDAEFFRPGVRSALRSVQNVLQYLRPGSELAEFAKLVCSIQPEQWAIIISTCSPALVRDLNDSDVAFLARALDRGIGFQLLFVPTHRSELVLTQHRLEAALNQAGPKRNFSGEDIFGGRGPREQMVRFSFPNHPIPVPILARSVDFKALQRYGKAPIYLTSETVARFRGTLAFLLADERRGMTWDIVSRRKQRTDVMIVVGDPNKGQQFLELLGTHAGLENEVYENICQRMLAGDANAPLKIMFLSSPQKMAIRFEHIRTFSAFALGEAIRKWARDFETLEPSRDIVSPLSPSRAVDVLGRRWAGSSSEVSTETLRKIERLISAPGDLLWVDEKRAPIMASLILNGLNVFAWCISGDLRHKGLKSARLKSEIREITSLLTFAARRAGWVCSMPRASYELGKALAIGDVLHAAYQKARNNELPNGKLAGAAELWQARKYPARVCDRMVKRLRPASRWASRLLYEKRKLSKVEAIAVAANARLRQFFGEERFQVGVFPENRVEHETMLFLGFQADVLYSTAT